jgi:hypothetical protein
MDADLVHRKILLTKIKTFIQNYEDGIGGEDVLPVGSSVWPKEQEFQLWIENSGNYQVIIRMQNVKKVKKSNGKKTGKKTNNL